jgi:hypothetical protein
VRTRVSLGVLVAGSSLAGLLAGCGNASEPDVQRVAAAFENPTVDPQSRCDLIAPATRVRLERSTPCPDAIGRLPFQGGSVRSVEIWGGGAQAKVGADTVFLTQTQGGWKVTAALCRSRGQEPYDCQVEGP